MDLRPRLAAFALIVAPCLPLISAGAEEPPPAGKYRLVAPMADGLNAVHINAGGDVVGFHWEPENGDENVIYEAPFLARGGSVTKLPLLPGYTATFPYAVSDAGLVVGRSSKPVPPRVFVHLRNQAFVWDAKAGIRGLGASDGYHASFATGVSSDGRRISGFLIGDGHAATCVWDREGDHWRVFLLPEGNRLDSNVVAISDDGHRVTAVQAQLPSLWTETAPGAWTREDLSRQPMSLIPRDVNNAGTVVGRREDGQGRVYAVIWSREGGMKTLDLPPGFIHGRAESVNNAGVVVGQIDGEHGSPIGPRGFLYENGRLRPLDEAGPDFGWAMAINDRGEFTGVLDKSDAEEREQVEAEAKKAAEAGKTP